MAISKVREDEAMVRNLSRVTMEWYNEAPTDGEAEVRLTNPKKTGSVTVRDYKDPRTSQMVNLVDINGDPKVVKYTKKKVLRLSNPEDRLEYVVTKNHPEFSLKAGGAPLTVICIQEEAKQTVSKREQAIEAYALIKKLSGQDLRSFARVLVTSPNVKSSRIRISSETSDEVIKAHLYNIADADPSAVLAEYNDPRRRYREMLRNGLENKTFTESKGLYKFGDQPMGISFEQAVEWLASDKQQDLIPNLMQKVGVNI